MVTKMQTLSKKQMVLVKGGFLTVLMGPPTASQLIGQTVVRNFGNMGLRWLWNGRANPRYKFITY